MNVSRHIGIVGVSAEGAALCYRTICVEGAASFGRHDHPEVTMHTHSLASYMRCIDAGDWDGVAELMLSSARKLRDCGADFLVCPDNTVHRALDRARGASPLPWLHIAEEVAAVAAGHGYQRLLVLGTRYLMESAVYPDKLAPRRIDHVIPGPDVRQRINTMIFDELVYGEFNPATRAYFGGVIAEGRKGGCDAVVLGCTEIPLLLGAADSVLPILDSTRLLARAALRVARLAQSPGAR
jgi:aspartate racemase